MSETLTKIAYFDVRDSELKTLQDFCGDKYD